MRKTIYLFSTIILMLLPAIAYGAEIGVMGQATGRGEAFVKTGKNWMLIQESYAHPITDSVSLMTEDGMLSIALNGGVRIEIKPDTEARLEVRDGKAHLTVIEGQAVINVPEGAVAAAAAGRVSFDIGAKKSAYANNNVIASIMADGNDIQAAAIFGSFTASSDGTVLYEFKPGDIMAFIKGRGGELQAKQISAVGEDASDAGPAPLTLGTSLAAIAVVIVAAF